MLAVLEVGATRIEQQLPESLKEVNYVGIYSKATESDFSEIKLAE